MNFTNPKIRNELVDGVMSYTPDAPCFDWCSIQQVVHSNNLELSAVIMIVVSFLLLVLYEVSDEIKIIRPFKEMFIYWAKLLLMLFLGFYILIIRMRLIW